jgi:predicted transcriptional regulator
MSLRQTSIWLEDDDIKALKRIGKRPEIDREWSYLVRKAMQEYIERDEKQHGKDK